MGRATNAFIDEIVWASRPRTIGGTQWRAIVYTLPERYGRGLKRYAYQYRRAAKFGSAPELWTDGEDHPSFARYLPNNGLPQQLKSLWDDEGGEAVTPAAPLPKDGQLSLAL